MDLVQTRGGLDLRPIVLWQEVQVEILEGFKEAANIFGASKGTKEFDERRRRLSWGCLRDMGQWRV